MEATIDITSKQFKLEMWRDILATLQREEKKDFPCNPFLCNLREAYIEEKTGDSFAETDEETAPELFKYKPKYFNDEKDGIPLCGSAWWSYHNEGVTKRIAVIKKIIADLNRE